MPQQLTFDLPTKPALGRDDFFVSPANQVAVALIDNWQDWPSGKLVLIGPHGSGKTHLAHVWANDTAARVLDAQSLSHQNVADFIKDAKHIVVEEADKIAGTPSEQALFHLHNMVLAEGGRLLITGTQAPNQWGLTLADLTSRVQAASIATLNAPDDALLSAVMVKLFSDRQIAVSPKVVAYLVNRMERSFQSVHFIVEALDKAALSQKREISVTLARQVLDNLPKNGA